MEKIAAHLGQVIQLAMNRLGDLRILITEIAAGVPHLGVDIAAPLQVGDDFPLTVADYDGVILIMNRVSPAENGSVYVA